MQREVRAVVATTSVNSASQEVQQGAEKYLTFRVATDIYAFPSSRVHGIVFDPPLPRPPANVAMKKTAQQNPPDDQ